MNVSHPTNTRYTLQWIITPKSTIIQDTYPNNNDATFIDQQLPKPADLLLHYNYSAATVKQWAKIPLFCPMGLVLLTHLSPNWCHWHQEEARIIRVPGVKEI